MKKKKTPKEKQSEKKNDKEKNRSTKQDNSFVDFIVLDQLSPLDVEARRMFGGYGLYCNGKFFGIIHDDCLFFKTDQDSRHRYVAAGMEPFRPNAKQTLKAYYQVPIDVMEDAHELQKWAMIAVALVYDGEHKKPGKIGR